MEQLPATGYEGLQEISHECWRCLAETVYMSARAAPVTPLIGNSPGVLDDIRLFLQNLLAFTSWYNITSWLHSYVIPTLAPVIHAHLLQPVESLLGEIRWTLLSSWSSWMSYLSSQVASISSSIRDPLSALSGYVYWQLWGLQQALGGGLASLRDYVYGALAALAPAVGGGLAALAGSVGQQLWSLAQTSGGSLVSLRDYVTAGLANLALTIRDPLAGLQVSLSTLSSSLPGHLAAALGTASLNLVNTVTALLRNLRAQIIPLSSALAAETGPVGRNLVAGLWQGVSSIPAAYLTWLSSTCGTDLALTPARALTSVAGLYVMSLAAGTAAHITSTVLDLVPTLNWVGASQFSAFVAQAAAFDPLTKAAYGTLINEAITVPLRYHWNQQLRPCLPTIGEIYTMGRKHGLSMSEFSATMAYQGLPDWWITKIYDFFWTDPSPMWLLRMCEGGIPNITETGRKGPWLDQWIPEWRSDPFAWLRMKLMLAGYEDIDIEPMITGMRARGMSGSITQVKTSARAMLRDAYWDEATAAAFLAPLGVRAEELHMLVTAEELDYQHEYLDDQVTYYVESFRKGTISEQDLNLALSTVYVKPERSAQVIARERIRKLPAVKTVTAAKEPAEVTKLRGQAVDSWLKQYRAWEISVEDLTLGLTIVTQDPDLAGRMVGVELTRFRAAPPKPKAPAEDPLVAAARRQAIATWVAAFRAGEIDAGELGLYLEPLVADKMVRKQLVQLESLRYSPTPELLPPPVENDELAKVRAEYVRGHIELFAKRQVSIEILYHYLQADGLVEPLARATVITQATKRIRQPGSSSPYYLQDQLRTLVEAGLEGYESAYMTGEITIDQYTAWLAGLTADQDVVTYLADVLVLRRFVESV